MIGGAATPPLSGYCDGAGRVGVSTGVEVGVFGPFGNPRRSSNPCAWGARWRRDSTRIAELVFRPLEPQPSEIGIGQGLIACNVRDEGTYRM